MCPRPRAKTTGYDLLEMYEVQGEAFDSVVAVARNALRDAGVWMCPTQLLSEINALSRTTLDVWPELRYLTDSTRHKWRTGVNGNAPVSFGEPDAAQIRDTRRTVIREFH